MRKQHRGFTLIEITIVLLIIGLIIGGILKGPEILDNTKIKSLNNDIKEIMDAFYNYQDQFNAIPGDDLLLDASKKAWNNAVAGNGNGQLIANDAFDAGDNENQFFWQHMRYSELISGDPAGKKSNQAGRANPIHIYDGKIGVSAVSTDWGLGLRGPILCAGNVPSNAASAVDSAFDDGRPHTGLVRSIKGKNNLEPAGITPAREYEKNKTSIYTVCKSL